MDDLRYLTGTGRSSGLLPSRSTRRQIAINTVPPGIAPSISERAPRKQCPIDVAAGSQALWSSTHPRDAQLEFRLGATRPSRDMGREPNGRKTYYPLPIYQYIPLHLRKKCPGRPTDRRTDRDGVRRGVKHAASATNSLPPLRDWLRNLPESEVRSHAAQVLGDGLDGPRLCIGSQQRQPGHIQVTDINPRSCAFSIEAMIDLILGAVAAAMAAAAATRARHGHPDDLSVKAHRNSYVNNARLAYSSS